MWGGVGAVPHFTYPGAMAFAQARSGLILPDNALDATDEYVSPEQVARDHHETVWFRRQLKSIDSRLDLIFVKPGSHSFGQDCRFYITRHNENGPDSYWMIQDELGEYSKPTWAHLERFQQGDTHKHPGLWREFEKEREMRKRAAEKVQEECSREFQEKLLERLDHIFDPAPVTVSQKMKDKVNG